MTSPRRSDYLFLVAVGLILLGPTILGTDTVFGVEADNFRIAVLYGGLMFAYLLKGGHGGEIKPSESIPKTTATVTLSEPDLKRMIAEAVDDRFELKKPRAPQDAAIKPDDPEELPR